MPGFWSDSEFAPYCWLQRKAATECNIMLPLVAFAMHYYPATRCNPILPVESKRLTCEIQHSAADSLASLVCSVNSHGIERQSEAG